MNSSVKLKCLSKYNIVLESKINFLFGECNSVGRVLDCGSKSHGFNTRYSPLNVKEFKALNGYLNIKKRTLKTKF